MLPYRLKTSSITIAILHKSGNKAIRSIGFLRRNLYSCPKDVQKAAYKGPIRPGSSVLDQQCVAPQKGLESVQKCSVRFVTGNYTFRTGILVQPIILNINWDSCSKIRISEILAWVRNSYLTLVIRQGCHERTVQRLFLNSRSWS